MNYKDGFGQGMYDGDIDINITNKNYNDNTNMNTNMNKNMNKSCCSARPSMISEPMMGDVSCPVVEPMRERVVYRNIYHTVPHA